MNPCICMMSLMLIVQYNSLLLESSCFESQDKTTCQPGVFCNYQKEQETLEEEPRKIMFSMFLFNFYIL